MQVEFVIIPGEGRPSFVESRRLPWYPAEGQEVQFDGVRYWVLQSTLMLEAEPWARVFISNRRGADRVKSEAPSILIREDKVVYFRAPCGCGFPGMDGQPFYCPEHAPPLIHPSNPCYPKGKK